MNISKLDAKGLIKLFLLTTTSLVASLVLAEVLLRLVPGVMPLELQILLDDNPDSRGVAHAHIGNLLEPNTTGTIWTRDFRVDHKVDAHGFRNSAPWPDKADIVVLGDSLVFGYGVESERAWPEQLAASLPGQTVVNLGLIGSGTQQHRRIYETFAKSLEPRLVVLAMFPANDFWDAALFERWERTGSNGNYLEWRDFGRQITSIDIGQPIRSLRFALRRYSYLYTLLRFARQALGSGTSSSAVSLEWSDGVTLQLRPDVVLDHSEHLIEQDEFFDIVLESVVSMRDQADRAGSKFLVVLQPGKEEVYNAFAGGGEFDVTAPLRAALTEHNIDYLDLRPAYLRNAAQGERLFFPNDGHPNDAGYSLTAAELSDYIKSNGLLEGARGSEKLNSGALDETSE